MNFENNSIHSLPVIMTRGVVIFPDNEIRIEVGRALSMAAVDESLNNYKSFVFLVCQRNLMQEEPTLTDIYEVGTLCQINSVKRKDGYMKVSFRGIERARLLGVESSTTFNLGDIQILKDESGENLEELALVRTVAKDLEELSGIATYFPPEIITQLAQGVSAPRLADQFAQHFSLPIERKQAILESINVNERLLLVAKELEAEKTLSNLEKEINDKVRDRIDENQKDYYLREKMRAIKEELGDVAEKNDEIDELRTKIETENYPEYIKVKLLEEISKYEMLPRASGESGVVRSYIDWVVKLPWWKKTDDIKDIKLVGRRLDEDHYGLEKPKERILEYLAVKQYAEKTDSPIICLVGPPGVGKTSLGKSVARSLDREFVKISVGGVRDEAEIRGHRRTYLGSMPGKIIQGMKKAGVTNPVFLIDEIDKMSSDFKGDPTSAMLEVLDPEQNKLFQDHYIEEEYDLSNVLFICTANYLEDIPAALRDRLEIINLSSYTEHEKVSIAVEHLLPKQLKNNGLTEKQFKVSDDMLLYIIRSFTREAGVRQLERVIGALCRKTVLLILKKEKKSITITKKVINEMLGKDIFDYSRKEVKDQVGVATGLAYTQFGGDILPIEVTHYPGKGNLVVTGQLGDVMKESSTVAFGYVKANADKFGIDSKFFETKDIQIHVPEGAVPKDGPSAGITITTALVSAITKKPIYSSVAMTGEVTLRGNVLPIGGLKEKSLAAHRSGIDVVLIPKGNIKDLEDIADTVKDKINFIPVSNMEQVLKEAIRV